MAIGCWQSGVGNLETNSLCAFIVRAFFIMTDIIREPMRDDSQSGSARKVGGQGWTDGGNKRKK